MSCFANIFIRNMFRLPYPEARPQTLPPAVLVNCYQTYPGRKKHRRVRRLTPTSHCIGQSAFKHPQQPLLECVARPKQRLPDVDIHPFIPLTSLSRSCASRTKAAVLDFVAHFSTDMDLHPRPGIRAWPLSRLLR